MGLFDQILGAMDNPNQQASPNQLGSILGAVQQLSGNQGVDAGTTQLAMSVLGGYVRSALQNVRSQSGDAQAQQVVNQFSGTDPNPDAVQSLFGGGQLTQIVEDIVQKTGLNNSTVQAMIPVLVPIVLNLLQTGSNAQNPGQGGNSVLNAFLDADGDGDVDMTDTMSMASRFLNQQS
ncbi:DUF937 domain-containing protein [Tychonema sp. BBK16]|uniref:DUF937 domain-containing protein n=1 Tax=Tychonema sp. BBK16 TaxID=2699888 RepID=UPI001F279C61|nr:DUF937 domain-containing protein [Tychonema sp. BBK16]MCF6374317.1 DUF937 domain-containing protein [Tychonema sp. BBK16]